MTRIKAVSRSMRNNQRIDIQLPIFYSSLRFAYLGQVKEQMHKQISGEQVIMNIITIKQSGIIGAGASIKIISTVFNSQVCSGVWHVRHQFVIEEARGI